MSAIALYNPLDEFQSYAIHYVMFVTRTTEEARAFTDQSLNTATLEAITNTDKLGGTIEYGTGKNAFLVMDTRRFSQFSVDRMEYEVLINGIQSGQPHGNLSTKISMTVQDQSGISFLNFLQYVMDEKMQTNFDGMVFMIRVIFVGTKNGQPTTVQDVTVPMMLTKMELNLDYAKGVYNLQFLPFNNFDVAANDRWMNVYMNASYFSGDSSLKLGGLINSFEAKLNEASTKFYNAAKDIKEAAAPGSTRPGRQVKYMFTIPKEWEDYTYNGAGVHNATETLWSKAKDDTAQKPGTPKDAHVAIEPGTPIPKVLELIFQQTQEVAKLGGAGPTGGLRTADSVIFYKFFAGITSNDDFITVHIDVVQFKIPNVIIQSQADANANASVADYYQTTSDGTRIPKNYAEFNYNFTGKNKDILHFDMKLQDLNIIFQSNLNLGPDAMQQVIDQGAAASGASNTNGVQKSVDLTSELITARAYDPIMLPKNTELELKNFRAFTSLADKTKLQEQKKTAQDYIKNLSLFYAMAPITAVMTIRGNPRIMDRFNEGVFLQHVAPSTNNGPTAGETTTNLDVKNTYREWFTNNIINKNTHLGTEGSQKGQQIKEFRGEDGSIIADNILGTDSYSSVPVFVKVNVKGPNKDFTGDFISGTDFATDILQNNYYVVFRVTNHFERDNFTQTLELWSQNVFGTGKLSKPKTTKTV